MLEKEIDIYQGVDKDSFVYIQRYGLGSYQIIKITKIEVTSKGFVWFWLGLKENHLEWHRDKLYLSLDELKLHRISQINDIEDIKET